MEKRIGTTIIRIYDRHKAGKLNEILSRHADIIIGRQGLPQTDGTSIISLVLEGTTDEIGSLTGQIGRVPGIQTKSVLLKND
jgi:putative iron-only hydrogenase system regulator